MSAPTHATVNAVTIAIVLFMVAPPCRVSSVVQFFLLDYGVPLLAGKPKASAINV